MSQSQPESAVPQSVVSTAPDSPDNQWVTVSEDERDETKIVFDTLGDEFVGLYIGPRRVENEDGFFLQQRFAVGEDYYFVNGNWSLNQSMSKVRPGTVVRIRYMSDKDTGMDTPMKVYRVDVNRKASRSRT